MCFYIRCPHKRFFLDLVLLDGPGLPGPGFFIPIVFIFAGPEPLGTLKLNFFQH